MMRSLDDQLAHIRRGLEVLGAVCGPILAGQYGVGPGHGVWRGDVVAALVEFDPAVAPEVFRAVIRGDDAEASRLAADGLARLFAHSPDLFDSAPSVPELVAVLDVAFASEPDQKRGRVIQSPEARLAFLTTHAENMTTDERRRAMVKLRQQLGDRCPPRGTRLGKDLPPGNTPSELQERRLREERRAARERPGQIAGIRARRAEPARTTSAKIAGT